MATTNATTFYRGESIRIKGAPRDAAFAPVVREHVLCVKVIDGHAVAYLPNGVTTTASDDDLGDLLSRAAARLVREGWTTDRAAAAKSADDGVSRRQSGELRFAGPHSAAGISRAASVLGRRGGSVASEAQRAAARENGKRGGRPKRGQ